MISNADFVAYLEHTNNNLDFSHVDMCGWNDMLRVLRSSQLLSSFAFSLYSTNKLDVVPAQVKRHFVAAMRFANAQQQQVKFAADTINRQCKDINVPVTFLKGAAYTLANTTNSTGRLFSDIDILVHKHDMPRLEAYLLNNGWNVKQLDDHDEQYYREWSHELPPFTHIETGANLDIHHTLLPPISGFQIDLADLWSNTVNVDDYLVPDTAYMILHSAVHLLLNEDIEKGLRDIFDIHKLIQTYYQTHSLNSLEDVFTRSGCTNEFKLLMRILKSLFTNEAYLQDAYLQDAYLQEITSTKLSQMYCQALFPLNNALTSGDAHLSRTFIYLRGHVKKMPVGIFIKHVCYKAYRTAAKRLFGDFIFR